MIKLYKSKDLIHVADFLKSNPPKDLFYSNGSNRILVSDAMGLNAVLKKCSSVYVSETKGDVDGFILVFKVVTDTVKRKYVKVYGKNNGVIRNLLTILLWNTNSELFMKVDINSPYMGIFKSKGFVFFAGRGSQILMRRINTNGSNLNNTRNKDS